MKCAEYGKIANTPVAVKALVAKLACRTGRAQLRDLTAGGSKARSGTPSRAPAPGQDHHLGLRPRCCSKGSAPLSKAMMIRPRHSQSVSLSSQSITSANRSSSACLIPPGSP